MALSEYKPFLPSECVLEAIAKGRFGKNFNCNKSCHDCRLVRDERIIQAKPVLYEPQNEFVAENLKGV